MRYISTRGQAPALTFEAALLTGLARDGGLYLPSEWPTIPAEEIAGFAGQRLEDVAARVITPFIGDAFDPATLQRLVDTAFASFSHEARCPLVQIGVNDWLLELHHGPTLAFKDVAMQLIGQFFQTALARRRDRITIVGATSGDTGSAAIEAFRGLDNVDVFILFPEGRISEVQRRQMTTPAEGNVHALAVAGDFDDCQARVKDMFNDHAFRDRVRLGAVNSINWARVLAQTVYYFTAAVALGAPARPVSFAVPTGNFGDIFAGYVARQMGLPIERLVIATNRNDILHRTLDSGDHAKTQVAPTISPSMDIQVSSNFERLLFELLDRNGAAVLKLMAALGTTGRFQLGHQTLARLREGFASARASEEETSASLKQIYAEAGQIVCPHTAVGLHAAARERGDPNVPMVTLATAHAAKFPDAVEAAIGIRPELPPRMADLYDRAERVTRVANDLAALQAIISERTRA
ncbi:MAG: threonine synthase [Pseudomonadota bacterium]